MNPAVAEGDVKKSVPFRFGAPSEAPVVLSGLRRHVLVIGAVPALCVVAALAVGMAAQRVMGVHRDARATARAEAGTLALTLTGPGSNTAKLPRPVLADAKLASAEILGPAGHVRARRIAGPGPAPDRIDRWLRRLGARWVTQRDLSAEAETPAGSGLRVWVTLRSGPWQRAAGLGIAEALALAGGLLLLGIVLSFVVSFPLVRRLRRISRHAARLARGEYPAPLSASHRGEIGLLEADINRLADTLRATRQRLDREVEEATAALQSSLAELEAKNAELDLARRQALEAGEGKSELLGMLSHELRTPLNAILGYARLLSRDGLGDSQRQALETIIGAARTLTRLLDGMLNLARAESGLLRIERKPFDLVGLIDETVSLFAPRAYAKRLDLIADCGGLRSLPVLGDFLRIQQVLSNVLGNAIKYTPRGRVSVHLDLQQPAPGQLLARLIVRDTGPGVAPDSRSRLFKRFERLDAPAALPGSGLGLAISNRLVSAMNGQIEVHESKDGGSAFAITLPLARVAAAADPAPAEAGRVFLWDPDPLVRDALAKRLRAAGADVEIASGRRDLIAALDEPDSFDGVVLGLAPGEPVPAPKQIRSHLLILACALDIAPPAGTHLAPKCLDQKHFENWFAQREEIAAPQEDTAAAVRLSPRLWRLLCEDTPTDLGNLGAALRDSRIDKARAAAHRIRGTAAFVQMRASERVARSLEKALGGPEPDLRAAWDLLARLGRTLLTELRRLAPPATERTLAEWRILVVDDNRLNGALLARHLEAHGAQVEHCQSAEEANQTQGAWQAILIDVHLGAVDGIQTGASLLEKFPEAILVAQTADVQPLTRRRAQAAGFHDYLTKPFDIDALPARLKDLRNNAGPDSKQRLA